MDTKELGRRGEQAAAEYLVRSGLDVAEMNWRSRAGEIDGDSIEKALTAAPHWKVPDDFHAVRQAQHNATALVSKDGSVARVIAAMARAACGKAVNEIRKRRFGLF